ncbi:hypothetical protein FPZ12_040015 [Amycolatopsis acidicola]|uniref:Uncharacterized protein n=1 Tax=Amycolatopsis acidicola TaxID=2596893 RepID=A0A5N0UMS7_9PSEU|nr:hypothetical protein [Amycolatopsis acidicola]KAA9150931.1 hypothetical protein FPZ12_040015 [Amycolatopsis acidicola]
MKVVAYAYPWDVADPGFHERVAGLGVDEVAVAVSYHSARAATPWSDSRTSVLARYAALYRPLREERWSRLKPGVPDWVASPDSAGEAVASLDNAAAWIVLTHNSRLGEQFPELTVRNCFGERYPWALCPSNEEVRDYAVTLTAESLAGLDVSSVILEACGQLGAVHQCQHEKTDAVWSPAVAQLLSVCCCESCGLESGMDSLLRDAVNTLMATGGDNPIGADVLDAILATRHRSTDLLRRAVLEMIDVPVTLHGSVDPWETGALPGLTPTASAEADAVVLPCWQPGETSLDKVRTARDRYPEATFGAYVTAVAANPVPDMKAYVSELARAGAKELHLYHVGLAGPARWGDVRAAVEAAHQEG